MHEVVPRRSSCPSAVVKRLPCHCGRLQARRCTLRPSSCTQRVVASGRRCRRTGKTSAKGSWQCSNCACMIPVGVRDLATFTEQGAELLPDYVVMGSRIPGDKRGGTSRKRCWARGAAQNILVRARRMSASAKQENRTASRRSLMSLNYP